MNTTIEKYSVLVFDCDGVVLSSNKLKAEAFYQAALPYGESAARALLSYHIENGGISRYQKFSYFLSNIVQGQPGPSLDALLNTYTGLIREEMLTCQIEPGLKALRERTPAARWLIVSGGDQKELREIFISRELDKLFDGGIYGSPDTKDEILARECASGNITGDALFVGDSRYDHIAATRAGLDFVFISQWSEFKSWKCYFQEHAVLCIDSLSDL
ncbi:HAD family hydrolase [Stutzerimonas nitrititolerans]|uniref:HAD family hydrolase n=1 Tax=Stutzerimonas nitrititolerans TaxID=2482751 RepID=UPI00289D4BAF|nr:HAD family hydrolase [Stutzerimonas nitrititolerans]